MFDGEFIRAVARDTRAARLHEAATDDLVRLAIETRAVEVERAALPRAVVATLTRIGVVRAFRPSVGRAVG